MPGNVRIGLMLSYAHSFYRDALHGIRQFAETRRDWVFMPVFVEGVRLRWHHRSPPDGLLATPDTPALATAVENLKRPIVTIGGVLPNLPYCRVAMDNRAVGRMAADHFLERGLKHFSFAGHRQHITSQEREIAFCDSLREEGFRPAPCYHTRRDRPFDPSAQQWYVDGLVDRWLLALPKPVGIFAADDILGAALTQRCRELDLRVPDDVAVLGVDNDDVFGRLSRPPLSSIICNAERVGSAAADLLARLLEGEKPPAGPILVPPAGVCQRRSSEVLAIDDEDVVAAARFVRERAHLPIRVADVLRAVPVSRRSLERRFQQALGRGVAEEIARVRLQLSKRLLAETHLSMGAVARCSGFTSARHLASTFRREVGSAPSEFRRRSRL